LKKEPKQIFLSIFSVYDEPTIDHLRTDFAAEADWIFKVIQGNTG